MTRLSHSNQLVIDIKNLSHSYGKKQIYKDLNLTIEPGTVFGLLGKNGVGKSTLIHILMGYLQPTAGQCMVFGEPSHHLSAETRQKIALLYEGFTSYDYMTIKQVEQFFAPFYRQWKKDVFYDLVSLMDVQTDQKLSTLSFGQKSQVVLGLLFAQDADLLILDDYSMGLDAGYRCLLVDYLKNYIRTTDKTVLITSHVMNDLEKLVQQIAIVDRTTDVYQDSMLNFCQRFHCYEANGSVETIDGIHRAEQSHDTTRLYSFLAQHELEQKLQKTLTEIDVSFEERFLGFVGKY
ncbi:MAG: ABC transporter ATP-binding protein [Desulfuromonadales bacterium]|nr:ABC transporter ATP-binding protein [Desulfuromonadales bacterium]